MRDEGIGRQSGGGKEALCTGTSDRAKAEKKRSGEGKAKIISEEAK